MRTVTFLVLEGIDKGRVYREMAMPVTIGREEGNALRLNDERVSRFHAKIQCEDNDIILTDLDSTNGTKVNGSTVLIRRLRAGDQVAIGRTMLLFGTMEEIEARRKAVAQQAPETGIQTIQAGELSAAAADRANNAPSLVSTPSEQDAWRYRDEDVPPLPQKLSGSQTARMAEVFDYLHRALTTAAEGIQANEDATEVRMGYAEWQTIQAVQLMLARYSRMVANPDSLE